MVKHTQTTRGQIDDDLFEFVWLFCGVALKALLSITEHIK